MDAIYVYRSLVGTFVIRPDAGGWRLWLGDEALGWYATAEQAAGDVAAHSTGVSAWDGRMPHFGEPSDLSEWERIPISRW